MNVLLSKRAARGKITPSFLCFFRYISAIMPRHDLRRRYHAVAVHLQRW